MNYTKPQNETTFKHTVFGHEKELYIGQKVECVYYHESIQLDSDKRRQSILSTIVGDSTFTPIKCGKIVGSAGVRPYYLSGSTNTGANGKELYLFVKFPEYTLKKAIPISCITDARQAANDTLVFLARNIDRVGQKGYSNEAYRALKQQADNALRFTQGVDS